MLASASMNCSTLMTPASTSSLNRQTSVPDPMSWPQYLPFSIGPPDTTMAGTSQLAAPITSDGVVLSQPQSRTTPSMGLARIDSSTSMLTRLRYSIAVGRMFDSPVDMTGKFERQAAGLPHAALDVLGDGPEVGVAGRQLRPGIADADDRAAVEHVGRQSLIAHPAAVDEAVFVELAEPGGRSIGPLSVTRHEIAILREKGDCPLFRASASQQPGGRAAGRGRNLRRSRARPSECGCRCSACCRIRSETTVPARGSSASRPGVNRSGPGEPDLLDARPS